MKTNPLVDFLAAYGPRESANLLYDEFVVEAAERTGCAPLEIEQPLVGELAEMLRSDGRKSVILTGTAGDGKTYTARRIVERLSGGAQGWGNTEKVHPVRLPTGGEVRFIKDLSELNDDDKKKIYPDIAAALDGSSGDVFVICVNDGHLLKFFRDHDGEMELHDKIQKMLREDERGDEDGRFLMINMSRRAHRDLVHQVLAGVVEHPGWDDCEGCPALKEGNARCPIRCNLDILRKDGPESMRARLKDMIRMAAADGRHLSVRQLILLTVNILLGDRKPGPPLLNCSRARKRAKDGEYAETNPYANAFGMNLPAKRQRQYAAFTVLGEFQVGFETNNYFDHGLLEGGELPECPYYGESIFASLRKRYRQEQTADAVRELQDGMIDQRRRLFFSLDPDDPDERKSPWNLSVFKNGFAYIGLADVLLRGKKVPTKIARDLLLGLNRMMIGQMTTTHDRLWMTTPSGVYLGNEISLLVQHAGRSSQGGLCKMSFALQGGDAAGQIDDGRSPVLRIVAGERRTNDLPMRPTLVECLLRTAMGALPASFSSECQREIERFQLQFATAVQDVAGEVTPKEVRMENGELQESPIAVMTQDDEW